MQPLTNEDFFADATQEELINFRERLQEIEPLKFFDPGFLGEDFNKDIVGITTGISLERLYSAYLQGIFPWFSEDEGEPVVWYSPSPRFCLRIEDLHVPKSVLKFLKHSEYTYTFDKDFLAVINGCRTMEREGENGTWIGQKIVNAYSAFHKLGFAHSVEVWHGEKLVGGLYGVIIGSVFFGESMFTIESNSAKSAFILFATAFKECGGKLIDSQVYTENIARFGAKNISRDAFLHLESVFLHEELTESLKEKFYEVCLRFKNQSPKTK